MLTHKIKLYSFLTAQAAASFIFFFALANNTLALPPADFEKIKVVGNLQDPTAFRFAPNGDIYIALQAGVIRILRGGVLLPTPVITLNANSDNEKGLLGMELDPNFVTNGYIYVSYTSNVDGFATLSRITVVNDIADLASEVVIDKSNQIADIFHNANDIKVGPDGKIWWLVGDNLQPASSQSLTNIHGKVHRFDMDLSSANDNPWHGKANLEDEIYAFGLRNPFRMEFLPSGKAVVGDVGSNVSEEFNIIESGANYGWPIVEGDCGACGYANPVYSYVHGGGAAITGLSMYNGITFPPQYQNVLFYGDYAKGVIRYLVFDENFESVLSDSAFDDDAGTVVDIHQGPDGNLYYLGIFEKTLWKIVPAAGNRTPIAQASADPIAGLAPLAVNFSSAGSSDPDGTPLTYNWDFGDTTSSTEANPIHTYNANGKYNVVLTVSDGDKNAQANLVITVGNELPSASIDTPVDGFKYNAGWQIDYSGSGSDPEDGNLPDSAFSWKIVFHHAAHIHPFLGPIDGVKSGNFVIPFNIAQEHDTWYRIELTVTDTAGLKKTVTRDIFPNLAQFTVQSNIPGTQFSVDGKLYTDLYSEQWVVGVNHGVSALSPQFIGASKYRFESWSDGGEQTHTIIVPPSDSTYTVNYKEVIAPPAPWQTVDVGPPAILGNTDYSPTDQSFTVDGAGWDIWDVTDQFHFVNQPLVGNGEVIAKVKSMTSTDPWTKAGVMIKESSAPLSSYVFVALTPGNGAVMQYNFNGSQGGVSYSLPDSWVKLTRVGNVFTSFISTDGVTWTQVGTKFIEMNAGTIAGLFVNSHNGAKLATAVFDSVTFNDIVDPPNTAPAVSEQFEYTSQDSPLNLKLKATDPDAGRLTFSVVTPPVNGVLSGIAPNLTYTPNVGFTGADSFTYKANDGQVDSNIASVNINIAGLASSVPSPWTNLDIGAPTASGSAEFADGIFFVRGGGNDIWHGVTPSEIVDQFHFVNQPFTGDGEIVARVTSQENTDEWAKAGVMIKQSASETAPYSMMSITPGNGFAFQSNFISDIHGVPYSFPEGWVKLTRIGNTFTGYYSADGVSWTQVGSFSVPMSSDAVAGLFVTSHNGSVTSRVTFDNVSINGEGVSSPLPAPWENADVGSPEIAGSASYSGGVFSVNGGGWDIWGSTDQFHYVYQDIGGDAEIIAKINSQTNTDPWAKAGLMIKESPTAFSPYALVALTPANGVRFQYNFNGEVANDPQVAPIWLKLTRVGDDFTAATSLDGISWTPLGGLINIPMSTTATVGFAVSSHNGSTLGTAIFDNVSVNATPPPPDSTGPTVSISSPAEGSAVTGVVNITASASDTETGVSSVEFYVDGNLLSTDTTEPYGASWDTTSETAGAHALTAKATDGNNNSTTSTAVSVTVEPPIEVFYDSFEVAAWNGLWTEDAQDDWFRTTSKSVHGSFSAEVDGLATDAQLISQTINLQGRTQARISFSWLIESLVDAGEYLAFDVSVDGGATWTEKAKLNGDVDTEDFWHPVSIDVNNITSGNLKIRFRGSMIESVEDADVDEVRVMAGISPQSPTTLFEDSFELGQWNGLWVEDAQNDWFTSTQRSTLGSFAAEVDGLATDASITSIPIDLQGKSSVDINFRWFIEATLDLGEYIAFDVSTDGGVSWSEKAKLIGDTNTENFWHPASIPLSGISNLQIRFRANMTDANEDVNIDMVKVTGN